MSPLRAVRFCLSLLMLSAGWAFPLAAQTPADSPYRCSFWFRTEFDSPKDAAKPATWLHFLGINYRANVWVNGQKIGDKADVAGAYRTFEFQLKAVLARGG